MDWGCQKSIACTSIIRFFEILYNILKCKILICTHCCLNNFIKLYHVREIPEWNQAFPSKKTFASAKWWRREQINMPLLCYMKKRDREGESKLTPLALLSMQTMLSFLFLQISLFLSCFLIAYRYTEMYVSKTIVS